jgi:hypothetical protein
MLLVAAGSIALTVSTPDDTDEYEALWSEINLSHCHFVQH